MMHRIIRRRRKQQMKERLGMIDTKNNNGQDDDNDVHNNNNDSSSSSVTIEMNVTYINASIYVLSGCGQPLLMTLLQEAGLADPSCQFYMLFYYLGPASVIFTLLGDDVEWPSQKTCLKACGLALWDIISTSLNYTGASLAGPTIFAIVYSSVTIWTALFSQLLLGRKMNTYQWFGVLIVFGGLTITANDTSKNGTSNVLTGFLLILFGSLMHALTYVWCESIMTIGDDQLSVSQNCALQGLVAAISFLLWQIVYTIPHFEELLWGPMMEANTTIFYALLLLFSFFLANLFHSITFFHTLRHFPSGATSAGVMKGLQAALVFVFTDWVYCGKIGGNEMCFSHSKLLSLLTVVGGVLLYGYVTTQREHQHQPQRSGYTKIDNTDPSISTRSSSTTNGDIEI